MGGASGAVIPHDTPTPVESPTLLPHGVPRDEARGRLERPLQLSQQRGGHACSIEKRAHPPDGADVAIAQGDPDQLRRAAPPRRPPRPEPTKPTRPAGGI